MAVCWHAVGAKNGLSGIVLNNYSIEVNTALLLYSCPMGRHTLVDGYEPTDDPGDGLHHPEL